MRARVARLARFGVSGSRAIRVGDIVTGSRLAVRRGGRARRGIIVRRGGFFRRGMRVLLIKSRFKLAERELGRKHRGLCGGKAVRKIESGKRCIVHTVDVRVVRKAGILGRKAGRRVGATNGGVRVRMHGSVRVRVGVRMGIGVGMRVRLGVRVRMHGEGRRGTGGGGGRGSGTV